MYSNSWLIGFLLFVELQQTILGRPVNQTQQTSNNFSVQIYESNSSCECGATNKTENEVPDSGKNRSSKLETIQSQSYSGHIKWKKSMNASESDPEVEHLSNGDNATRRESDTLKRETFEIYSSNNHEYVEEGSQMKDESEAPGKLLKSSLGSFVTNFPNLLDLQKNKPAVFGKSSKTMSDDDD